MCGRDHEVEFALVAKGPIVPDVLPPLNPVMPQPPHPEIHTWGPPQFHAYEMATGSRQTVLRIDDPFDLFPRFFVITYHVTGNGFCVHERFNTPEGTEWRFVEDPERAYRIAQHASAIL